MLTVPLVPLVHVTLPSYPRREILVPAVPFTFPSVTLNWKVWVRVAYIAPVSGRYVYLEDREDNMSLHN